MLVVIVIATAARLLLAWAIGLSVDESYAVVVSRQPSLGYFDHPPLAFWIAGGTARLFGSEHRVLLRAPFVLLFAGTTWLTYRLAARLFGERAGFFAALLLNLAPVFALSTGGWILPDGPLDFALVAAALALSHVLLEPAPVPGVRSWLTAGAAAAVAFLSKYHAIFLVLGTLAFLVTRREARHWLRRPAPYIAATVALIGLLPALLWNDRHGFVSFRFQGGRAAAHGVHPGALAQNVAGQALYLMPWIWALLVWQLIRALRAGPRDGARWLLACLAIGPVALFTLVSLGGNPGLPHWPAPGYLLLFPLAGEALARWEQRGRRAARAVRLGLVGAATVFVLLAAIAASDIATGWVTRARPEWFRRGDPSLEAYDWTELRAAVAGRGLLHEPSPLVATTHWIHGAKLGYALGPDAAVLCLSDDPRQFFYAWPPGRYVGRDALLLVPDEPGHPADSAAVKVAPYFASVMPAGTVVIHRSGETVLRIAAYRAARLLRAYPSRLK